MHRKSPIGLQDGYDETRPADYTADPVTVPAAAARTGVTVSGGQRVSP